MAVPEDLTSLHKPEGLPARIALRPPDDSLHRIDGTWWPRSYDLSRELPALITALEPRWPGITRVTVSRTMWRIRPDSVTVGDREVHINRSVTIPYPHMICLLAYGVGRCDLLVAPAGV